MDTVTCPPDTPLLPEVQNVLDIVAPAGRPMVSIKMDGSIEYGPDYTPDEAALIFWTSMRDQWGLVYPGTSGLTLNGYQAQANDTAGSWARIAKRIPPWLYCALAVAEEAGEVAGKSKKFFRDDVEDDAEPGPERKQAILLEMGDTLWYLAALAGHLGFTLEDVAAANFEKLTGRRSRGTMKGDGDDR